MTWREASRKEVNQYYHEEFPEYAGHLPSFLTNGHPKELGIELEPAHPIKKGEASTRSFIRRDTYATDSEGNKQWQLINSFGPEHESGRNPTEILQDPAGNDPADSNYKLVHPDVVPNRPNPVPKTVYASLDNWDRPRVTAVDIDAKDVALERANTSNVTPNEDETTEQATLREAGILDGEPQGFYYEFQDIQQAISYGFQVAGIFESNYNSEATQVVYSGQGAHVYLLDSDPYHRYDEPARKVIAADLQENHTIPIDEAVTIQENRLLRVPYTLHAGVSRIVTPIDEPGFDFRTQAKPKYLT